MAQLELSPGTVALPALDASEAGRSSMWSLRSLLPKALFVAIMAAGLIFANTMPAIELAGGASADLSDVAQRLNLTGNGWVTSLCWLAGIAGVAIFLLFPISERFIRTVGTIVACLAAMILPYFVATHEALIDPEMTSLGSGLILLWITLGVAAVVPWLSLLWWERQPMLLGRHWSKWLFLLPAIIWILGMAIFPLVYAFTTSRYGFRNGRINRFVGWDNYRRLWNEGVWGDAIRDALVAGAIAAAAVFAIGIVYDVVANRELGLSAARSTLGFVPVIAIPVGFISLLLTALKDPLDTQLSYTVFFVVSSVAIEMVFGSLLALLMHRELKGRGVLRAVMTLPLFAAPVGIGFLFRTIFYEGGGPVNTWLDQLGIGGKPWLSDPDWSKYSTIIADAWLWIPFVFVIALAGLQSLPQDVIEAAEVDGASAWHVFRFITIPLMTPILWLILLLRTIDAFKVFDIPASLTLGGPGRSTEYWSLFNYRTARKTLNYGDAAVQAFLLLIIVSLIVGLLWGKIQKVYEEEGLKG